MKDIRPALRSFLLGSSEINTIVGGQRIYTVVLPQGMTQDSIVFTKISSLADYKIKTGLTGLMQNRIQVDSWCQTAEKTTTLSDAIRERIDGYQGLMGSGATEVNVQGVFLIDQGEEFDNEVKMFRNRIDFMFHYDEL